MPKKFTPNDPYFYKAKKMGFRARSAFKLLEILQKFPKLLPPKNGKFCDLGAAPGSFLQVLKTKNPKILVGVDLQKIKKIDGAELFVGDIFSDEILKKLASRGQFDFLSSDLAPKTTGQKDLDQWHSVELCERVLAIFPRILKPGGNAVMKIFVGADFDDFLKKMKKKFAVVKIFKPKACRDRSFETYLVARLFSPDGIKK